MIDKRLLPPKVVYIVDSYFSKRLPRLDYDHLVLLVLYGCAKILCHHRVVLRDESMDLNDTCPNIYMLIFSKSGSGKDLSIRTLNKIMAITLDYIKTEFKMIYKEELKALEDKVEQGKLKNSAAQAYRDKHQPLKLTMGIDSSSTVEGFISMRAAFMRAGIGATCWEDSEIFDSMKSLKGDKNEGLITANKKCYDFGDNERKIIKSEKQFEDIKGVPNNASLHGPMGGNVDLFKSFFDFGYARRSYVYVEDSEKEFVEYSLEELDSFSKEASENEDKCIKIFKDLYTKVMKDSEVENSHGDGGRKVVRFTKGASDKYKLYKQRCEKEECNYNNEQMRGMGVEVAGRPWRAVKLSAIICALEDVTGELTVSEDQYEKAIGITDYYGQFFKRFYCHESDTEAEKLADYLLNAKGPVLISQIGSLSFLGASYRARKQVFEEVLRDGLLDYYLGLRGKELIEQQIAQKSAGRPATAYIVNDLKDA